MTRQLFHVSLGVLALAFAYRLGASSSGGPGLFLPQPAAAGVVLDDEIGIVSQWAEWMLDSNGDTWEVSNGCWQPGNSVPLPVAVADLKFWHPTTLVTKDFVLWRSNGATWESCGPWPGTPISVERDTWGSIKQRFQK